MVLVNPHAVGSPEAAKWDARMAKAAALDFSTSKMLDAANHQPITFAGNRAMAEWHLIIDICRKNGALRP